MSLCINDSPLHMTDKQGKCIDTHTEVLLWNGGIALAKDIVPGDILVGDDQTPRLVHSICRGYDNMFTITQTNGMDYKVNSEHIITLKLITHGQIERIESGVYKVTRLSKEFPFVHTITFTNQSSGPAKQLAQTYVSKLDLNDDLLDIKALHYATLPNHICRQFNGVRVVNKDTILCTNVKVRYAGQGEYAGLTLSGNRRFLLGDGTVTHNTDMLLL